MSDNEKNPSMNSSDSCQLDNLILDSRSMCHITPEVSEHIPGSFEDTYKHTAVAEGHNVKEIQKGQV